MAATGKHKDNVEWSGQDIISRYDPYKARIAINLMNDIRVWPEGFFGYFKRFRVPLKTFMRGPIVENLMTLCVLANTIVLGLDHYGISDEMTSGLQLCNTVFTIVFAIEMFTKIFAVGI